MYFFIKIYYIFDISFHIVKNYFYLKPELDF